MIRRSSMFYALWLPVPGLVLIGLGFGSRSSRQKNLMGFLLLWTVLASLIVLPACGSSSSGGNSGTPAGTYTVTISGTDANRVTQSNIAPTTVGVAVN
jgi:hypothetical protein